MSYYISDKVGKARKRHECRVCGNIIQPGEACHIYKGVEDGEGFYTLHFHPVCWDYSRKWEEQDWENCSPGSISLREVEEEMAGSDTAGQSELIEPLEAALLCVKCKIPMKTGKALLNNLSGIPDFIGDTHCCTVSPDGTARLIDCLKCPECGKCVSP